MGRAGGWDLTFLAGTFQVAQFGKKSSKQETSQIARAPHSPLPSQNVSKAVIPLNSGMTFGLVRNVLALFFQDYTGLRPKKKHQSLKESHTSTVPHRGGGLGSNVSCRNISGRTVWKEIIKAGNIADSTGSSFSSAITKCLGSGDTIEFWNDIWFGSECFSTLFPRLYRLETKKEASIAERITHINGSSSGNWCWTRPPTGRVLNELTELNNIVSSIALSDKPDSWKYTLDPSGTYTTKSLAHLINTLKFGGNALSTSIPRNKLLPQKVYIFIWRAFQNKIPVRFELDKRGIDLDSILCPLCDVDIETTEHILGLCPNSALIWKLVLDWWAQDNTLISNLNDVIINNQAFASNNFGSTIWQATKWITCYIMWKHRNLKVFSKKVWSPASILSEIQTQSYSWISKRSRTKKTIEWHQWLINPSFFVAEPPQRVGIG
ncbi:uncharacterized protein [Rutidosis leptorrhynchoides]|uniref:uncharacterized protein n=1 Tax=Rutidosis leptorrhynchoides TaxID=125765 RepID=UPI003A99F8C4